MENYSTMYLENVQQIASAINESLIEKMIDILIRVRETRGRLFILGVGGGAGNATHAVNDFRKICDIETYAPTDNVSEMTARINDDGWESVFTSWLRGSRLQAKDALLIFSVGGGNKEKKISSNIVEALSLAQSIGTPILGIVGRDGGYTAMASDACIIIPTVNSEMITPLTESFQSVISHLLTSHPRIKVNKMKWEAQI